MQSLTMSHIRNPHFTHYHPLTHSLGGENLAVAQNNYMVLWFKGKELNMVFGISLSLSRVVSVTHHLTLTLTHTHTHHTQHTHTHTHNTHTHTYHTFLHPQHSNPSTQASTINMNVNQKLYSSIGAVNPEHVRLALVLLLGMC